jgi:hypothetical protein
VIRELFAGYLEDHVSLRAGSAHSDRSIGGVSA